ncbi:unnamed protein product, partial [Mesorhabditis belari]|uniref:Uncharacterized protein n=1 Tax=Mesorhabditis belari TaxID=2138241 RepID=A0AAF3FIZ7_9BILA
MRILSKILTDSGKLDVTAANARHRSWRVGQKRAVSPQQKGLCAIFGELSKGTRILSEDSVILELTSGDE